MSIHHGHQKLTETIIGSAMRVSNTLGAGFLEKVYHNALAHELRLQKISVEQEALVDVFYRDQKVGEYRADLIVDRSVIVEVKAVKAFDNIHAAQLLNYLRATRIGLGLLLNFGTPRLGIKRIALSRP